MSSNVKIIKFTFWLSLFFLIATYIVTLNIEIGFLVPNSPWLSNSFFLTILGGMFGSSVVVLICEVEKYLINKRCMEDYFFNHSSVLSIYLLALYNSLNTIICNGAEISDNNFLNSKDVAKAELNAIKSGDYTTLSKGNSFKKEINNFLMSDWITIDEFLRDCDVLRLAILTDKQEQTKEDICKQLESNDYGSHVNEKNKNVNKTLRILLKKAENSLKLTERFLQIIDSHCDGRYKSNESIKLFEQQRKIYSEDILENFYEKNCNR